MLAKCTFRSSKFKLLNILNNHFLQMWMSRMRVNLIIHHKKFAFVTCMHLTYCRQCRQKPSSSTRCHSLNEQSKSLEKKKQPSNQKFAQARGMQSDVPQIVLILVFHYAACGHKWLAVPSNILLHNCAVSPITSSEIPMERMWRVLDDLIHLY